MSNYVDIIKSPMLTEASLKLVEKENKYTFKVNRDAHKDEITKAIESLFNVTVESINTANYVKKPTRRGNYTGFKPAYKKAVVKLAKGQKIAAFNV
ncbi:MAG: 50S ribosomal protein L23 [Acholeplasmatales bacterium]|jgi:large subunit ribosomal protein L23|nr:50S ribosomal protein L23 [Acholeplasmatales bacterium]